jgi:hypothetical protein
MAIIYAWSMRIGGTMAYYPDLSPCDYFGRWEDILLAVGWNEHGYPFTTGSVSPDFFAKLFQMLTSPWEPVAVAGHQRCPFCRFTGGPTELYFKGGTISVGRSNLFVPCKGGVYVAPSMVAHYIDAHEYCPPSSFQEAVLVCPEMKSFSYLKEMKARRLPVMASTG